MGNVIQIRDKVVKYGSDALRLNILSKHYRNDIVFDEKELIECKSIVIQIFNAVRILNETSNSTAGEKLFVDKFYSAIVDKFYSAMDDDFDTPTALTALIELCNNLVEGKIAPNKMVKREVAKMVDIFGLTLA